MSFHFDSALRYQSTMSTQASASKTPPEDTRMMPEWQISRRAMDYLLWEIRKLKDLRCIVRA
ncbi:hypothetical protein FOVG_03857 [Fusarium oxysporum f. sp. pisi HDV247]|uniref:Uncharacterized protein n=1 Tax=Fusarium oxysporum f. sp. pisi HDV247 TaxID=1080344 RepID=W9PW24_FUSOX|nr:hypothetical protein FOVG_03857 [Fusarium oxysporum f. sp. pisi HDV247]